MIDIALTEQIHLYSIDTSYFYSETEDIIHNELNQRYFYKSLLEKKKRKYNRLIRLANKGDLKVSHILKRDQIDTDILIDIETLNKIVKKSATKGIERIDLELSMVNRDSRRIKQQLKDTLDANQDRRTLIEQKLMSKDKVSLFSSALTRTMGLDPFEMTEDLIIVKTYYFKVLEDLIKNGFIHRGEKYIVFTASAGQIRTKKTLFIKESTHSKIIGSITCGLSEDDINRHGGVNINKYLAYLALCNSATEEWVGFDINKTIVVEDFESSMNALVDFIDEESYEITRQEMDISIEHTDGCGMVLPSMTKKAKMIRLPWVKGLLVPFPFDKFIREARAREENKGKNIGIVTDIYGREVDILKEKIQVIMTKSQFKMWRYYKNWNEYQEKYISNGSHCAYCNEEKDTFRNGKLNYQMLQTLTDIKEDELDALVKPTVNKIVKMGEDRETMLRLLGATKSNFNKNYFQEALSIYPELLQDAHSKEVVKQTKASFVKKARSGKLNISGKYTFMIPDLYAFCERLILGKENPTGLLENGEVFCNLYKEGEELDCLRSPHLYREHAVRINNNNAENKRWFISKGLYTSCHDPINRILQADNDGDTSLVVNDKNLVGIAKRNMVGIVPLYYEMKSAKTTLINENSVYNGLENAYKGGNIGVVSNDITKVWNSNKPDLDIVAMLTMENNFVIDFAKTLYKLTRPKEINDKILEYTRSKLPHFFRYAKDKTTKQVEKPKSNTMDKIHKRIPNTRIDFSISNVGCFDYRILLSDKDKKVRLNWDIINMYEGLNIRGNFLTNDGSDKTSQLRAVYHDIRVDFIERFKNVNTVVDTLVEYLYEKKEKDHKTALWECFGDVLVSNIEGNIDKPLGHGWVMCDYCGERVEIYRNRRYCGKCQVKVDRKKAKTRMQKLRTDVRS